MTTENIDELAWASNTLAPVRFWPPLLNPSAPGLYAATNWTELSPDAPVRWLESGVQVRPVGNFDRNASGLWDVPWCDSPGSDEFGIKYGTRPDPNTVPFAPMTLWAYDSCDPTQVGRDESRARVQQILRMNEPIAVETEFAARLLADATALHSPIATAADLVEAIGYLEGKLAATNSVGVVHSSAQWTARAAKDMILVSSGTAKKTPAGHAWCLGGGYVAGLGDTLVATSPLFGWRSTVVLREVPLTDGQLNTFSVIAERSVVVGYEALIAAVTITGESA